MPLADRTWRVHNGSVRTVIEGDMVAIALTGPRDHLPQLLDAARYVGFAPDEEPA